MVQPIHGEANGFAAPTLQASQTRRDGTTKSSKDDLRRGPASAVSGKTFSCSKSIPRQHRARRERKTRELFICYYHVSPQALRHHGHLERLLAIDPIISKIPAIVTSIKNSGLVVHRQVWHDGGITCGVF